MVFSSGPAAEVPKNTMSRQSRSHTSSREPQPICPRRGQNRSPERCRRAALRRQVAISAGSPGKRQRVPAAWIRVYTSTRLGQGVVGFYMVDTAIDVRYQRDVGMPTARDCPGMEAGWLSKHLPAHSRLSQRAVQPSYPYHPQCGELCEPRPVYSTQLRGASSSLTRNITFLTLLLTSRERGARAAQVSPSDILQSGEKRAWT